MTDYRMNRYIARGVRTDCRVLIDKFCKYQNLRYEQFTQVWREMKFSYLYFGRKSFDELLEFTEEALRIAKEFWLDDVSLNEKVGGLYTLYGLYVKQITGNQVKIRITLNEMKKIVEFRSIIQNERHHDVNYILSKLFVLGAFQFCVTTYFHGLEKNIRRYHEVDRSSSEKNVVKYPGKFGNKQILQDLEDALKQYEGLKKKVSEQFEGSRFSLDSSNIVGEIRENLNDLKPTTENPVLFLSADAVRKAKEGDNGKTIIKGGCVLKSSTLGTEGRRSQFELLTGYEDENRIVGTSKLHNQKQRGRLPDLLMLCEEACSSQSSGRTSVGMIDRDDSETEGDSSSDDKVGGDGGLAAEKQKQDRYLLSMPLLWEEASTSQNSGNVSLRITEEGCPHSDEEGTEENVDYNVVNVSDDESLDVVIDDLENDGDSVNTEQNKIASDNLPNMPVL